MRPYQRLPLPFPAKYDPSEENPSYFYDNFLNYFIPDMIKMMDAGLHIDEKAVDELRKVINTVLKEVSTALKANKIIMQYQKYKLPAAQKVHAEKATQSIRTSEHYLKEYRANDIIHRTWVMNAYLKSIKAEKDVKDKWSVAELKKYNVLANSLFINSLIDKTIDIEDINVKKGMLNLAEYKVKLWNKPRYSRIDKANPDKVKFDVDDEYHIKLYKLLEQQKNDNPEIIKQVELLLREERINQLVPPFNPGSAKQKQELFEMLKIKALDVTETGAPSWGRDQLEDLQDMTTDKDLLKVLKALIDHSFSAIIKNNFIKAFDSYTIDGVLHGNIRLGGAKTWRNTSNSPNLLNMPSTGSIYAKPLKRCFTAPEDMLVIQADYSSLEDVVLANLTLDEGKLAIQQDKTLDAHCYNALGYYPNEIEAVIGSTGSYKDKVRRFKLEVDNKNKILKDVRQKSKPNTFKLAYLGFPDADKGGTITKEIYDNYHNTLYPGVKDFLDSYVIPTTRKQGYLHLGLGARIYCDNVKDLFRTLFNSNFQFWSILTLISVNEMNYRIEQEKLTKEIQLTSTIYDSIYANIIKDPEIIKWYNDNLVEIGKKDFLVDQAVPNTLECAIGRNWSEEIALTPNASIKEIEAILTKF